MLQVQTRKPPRTLNHHANIRTDKPTPNSMMTRVQEAGFQPLNSDWQEICGTKSPGSLTAGRAFGGARTVLDPTGAGKSDKIRKAWQAAVFGNWCTRG
jgi:hypothetical protein